MTLPRLLTAVPQTWPVRLEIMRAIHTLAKQIAEDGRHLEEIVFANRSIDPVAESFCEYCRELRKAGFNPSEPRVLAGNPDGGQWTSEGTTVGHNDPRVVSDATPDNTWTPGDQYAANDQSKSADNKEPPAIPEEEPATRHAVNTFLKAA